MKKLSLPFIVNSVLSFALILPFLTLVFGASGLKFFTALSVALPLAITASLGAGVLLTTLSKGKSPFDAHNPRMLILNACTDDELQAYFSAYFQNKHKCTYATDKHLTIFDENREGGKEEDGQGKKDETGGDVGKDGGYPPEREYEEEYYLAFYPEEVRANDLATIELFCTESAKAGKLTVLSMAFSPAAVAYAEKRKIRLCDEKQILGMLDEFDLLEDVKKKPLAERLKGLFNPVFGKKAIFYGLFIAALFPLVTFGLYYAIFGLALFAYGLTAVLVNKFSAKSKG